jgi:hypothetical protein
MAKLPTKQAKIVTATKEPVFFTFFVIDTIRTFKKENVESMPPRASAMSAKESVHIMELMPPRLRRLSKDSSPDLCTSPEKSAFKTPANSLSCIKIAKITATTIEAVIAGSAETFSRLRVSMTTKGRSTTMFMV